MENRVGFRFIPTDEEIVDHYIRLKNLGGDTSHIDKVISTVDVCSFDPWELPSKSRRESRDQIWYFFGRKENRGGERQSRKTKSGFWKKTGDTMNIVRKRGNRDKIGEKRVLVFHSNPQWVMHEYVATFLPPTAQMTYTVCKVIFKGDPSDLPSSSSAPGVGGEVEHNHSEFTHMYNSGGSEGLQNERHFTGLLDAEKETQIDDAIRRAIDNFSTHDLNCFVNYNYYDEEQGTTMFMQENRNDYRPRKPLTGVFIGHSDDDSDSDSLSPTTGSIQTSSTCDSFGCSSRRIDQMTESPNSTTKLVSLTPVVSKILETSLDASKEKKNHYGYVQGTEMEEYETDQEVLNNKRAGFFYRKIRNCIKKILLCSSIPQEHDN